MAYSREGGNIIFTKPGSSISYTSGSSIVRKQIPLRLETFDIILSATGIWSFIMDLLLLLFCMMGSDNTRKSFKRW